MNEGEILECARYGELAELKECLESGISVDYKNEAGATALHMACANGHLEVVTLLCESKAAWTWNESGNSPLHWAIQNKQEPVIKYLLTEAPFKEQIDVFKQNDFGKSAVSEGFAAGIPDALVVLLSHSSAERHHKQHSDKQKKGSKRGKADAGDSDLPPSSQAATVDLKTTPDTIDDLVEKTHAFNFDPSRSWEGGAKDKGAREGMPVLLCREIGSLTQQWGQEVFTEEASDDTTGCNIWAASVLLSRWIVSKRNSFKGHSVIELGAGCALPSIVVRHYTDATRVVASDYFANTVDNIRHNVNLNPFGQRQAQTTCSECSEGGASKRCGNCHIAVYCSKECQRKAWKTHKLVCAVIKAQHTQKTHDSVKEAGDPAAEQEEKQTQVEGVAVDWANKASWPTQKFHTIIGSDLIYHDSLVPVLVQAICGLLEADGRVLYVARKERQGMPAFLEAMTEAGFTCQAGQCGKKLFANPLVDASREECDAFFHLDPTHRYKTYCFTKSQLASSTSAAKKKKRRPRKKKTAVSSS